MMMTVEGAQGKRATVLPHAEEIDPSYIGQEGYIVDGALEDGIFLYRLAFENLVDEYFGVDEIRIVED